MIADSSLFMGRKISNLVSCNKELRKDRDLRRRTGLQKYSIRLIVRTKGGINHRKPHKTVDRLQFV